MCEPGQPDDHRQLIEFQCLVCGAVAKVPATTPRVHCACGFTQEGPSPGLGDVVAAGLHGIGITKERYQASKAAVGLKRCCNCGKRQRQLNEIGKRLGIG